VALEGKEKEVDLICADHRSNITQKFAERFEGWLENCPQEFTNHILSNLSLIQCNQAFIASSNARF
jgi:hypothetical protein